MTKPVTSVKETVSTVRAVRPFLFLKPARLPLRDAKVDPIGVQRLDEALSPSIPALVRSIVDFTIELQNRRAIERGNPQPIQLSVLNRRRRAARAWLVAIAEGRSDAATRHAVATQWIPLLTSSGHDLAKAARSGAPLIEFVRGAATACIFDLPAESLLPHARALHVLETTLGTHLAALQQIARDAAS
jgi:hypothetical protein